QPEKVITFKKATQDDAPLIYSWFEHPHVKTWWPLPENETLESFTTRIRSKDTFAYVVLCDNKPIGYIQYYIVDKATDKTGAWLPELPPTTVGTDQFIGDPDYLGKGYGTLFIKEFITYLTTVLAPGTTTIIVDPEPANSAAIKCYKKVGFKEVGEFTTPFGPALLMRYNCDKNSSKIT